MTTTGVYNNKFKIFSFEHIYTVLGYYYRINLCITIDQQCNLELNKNRN